MSSGIINSTVKRLGGVPEHLQKSVAIMIMLLSVWMAEVKDYVHELATLAVEDLRSGRAIAAGVNVVQDPVRAAEQLADTLATWYEDDNSFHASETTSETIKSAIKLTNGGSLRAIPDVLQFAKFVEPLQKRVSATQRRQNVLPGVVGGSFLRVFDTQWDTVLVLIYDDIRSANNFTKADFVYYLVYKAVEHLKICYVPWAADGTRLLDGHWRLLATSDVAAISRLVETDISDEDLIGAGIDAQVVGAAVGEWRMAGNIRNAHIYINKTNPPAEWRLSNCALTHDGKAVTKDDHKWKLVLECIQYVFRGFHYYDPWHKYILMCAHMYASSVPYLSNARKPTEFPADMDSIQRHYASLGVKAPALSGGKIDYGPIFVRFIIYAICMTDNNSPRMTLSREWDKVQIKAFTDWMGMCRSSCLNR